MQLNEAELAAMLAQAINLAAACCNTGETARAKALFTEIAARGDLTDHHRAAVDDSLRKIAAHEVSAGTTKAESSAPAPDADEEARS